MPNLTINPDNVLRVSDPDNGGAALARLLAQWGEAVTAGDAVYLDTSTDKWFRCDATDAAKPPAGATIGVAMSSGVANQWGGVTKLPGAVIDLGDGVMTPGKPYYASATLGALTDWASLTASVNEVQRVSMSGGTSGTFTLTYNGTATAAIAWDATAAAVKSALEAHPDIDQVDATGGPVNTADVDIEFQGSLAATDLAEMTIDDSSIGGTPASGISTPTAGVAGDQVVHIGTARTDSELVLVLDRLGIQK